MFNKTIFSFPRKLLNGLESVFAKHHLRQKKKKKPLTKSCSYKQSFKCLTQNKIKRVDPKTLVQS